MRESFLRTEGPGAHFCSGNVYITNLFDEVEADLEMFVKKGRIWLAMCPNRGRLARRAGWTITSELLKPAAQRIRNRGGARLGFRAPTGRGNGTQELTQIRRIKSPEKAGLMRHFSPSDATKSLHAQGTVGQTFLSAEKDGRQECLPHGPESVALVSFPADGAVLPGDAQGVGAAELVARLRDAVDLGAEAGVADQQVAQAGEGGVGLEQVFSPFHKSWASADEGKAEVVSGPGGGLSCEDSCA